MFKLRELEKRDLATINKWRNDPGLICFLGSPFRYIAKEVDEEWYMDYLKNRGRTIRCAIVDDELEDHIMGLISLTNIDSINRNAELHIMIGKKENRGMGLGSFAIKAIVNHAFNNMNIHRIELEVLEDNLIARKLYKKIGFVEEGLRREIVFKNGNYKSMVLMSLLRTEYEPGKQS